MKMLKFRLKKKQTNKPFPKLSFPNHEKGFDG